jgi:hypothetical protein
VLLAAAEAAAQLVAAGLAVIACDLAGLLQGVVLDAAEAAACLVAAGLVVMPSW